MLVGSIMSVGPEYRTQVVKLGCKHLYPRSHLAGLHFFLRQSLSLNLKLTNSPDWIASFRALLPQGWDSKYTPLHLTFFVLVGILELDLSPRACKEALHSLAISTGHPIAVIFDTSTSQHIAFYQRSPVKKRSSQDA